TLWAMRAAAGAFGAIAALFVGLIAGGGGASNRQPHTQSIQASTSTPAPAPPSPLPGQPPTDQGQLAADLGRTQRIIDDPTSTNQMQMSAGRFEQLATVYL